VRGPITSSDRARPGASRDASRGGRSARRTPFNDYTLPRVSPDEGPIVAVDVIRRMAAGDAEPVLPTIAETLSRATVLGSVERAVRNRALARLLITPEVQDIPLRNFRALERAIEAGRRAAEQALERGGKQVLLDALHEPFEPVASQARGLPARAPA
jgi:predicted acylesterase/phospholipase RssA